MDFATLLVRYDTCSFQDKLESNMTPRNLVDVTISVLLPSIYMFIGCESILNLGPKIIACVLSRLSESLLALNHWINKGISLLSLLVRAWVLLPVIKRLESSANIIGENRVEIEPRSFIYRRNRIGPRMEPWGTPHLIILVEELTPLYVVNCFLLLRLLSTHEFANPLIP